jgi:hypothetical protein
MDSAIIQNSFELLINFYRIQDGCGALTKLNWETQQRNRQLLMRMLQCTMQAAQVINTSNFI